MCRSNLKSGFETVLTALTARLAAVVVLGLAATSAWAQAPFNDNFPGTTITGSSGTFTALNNLGATKEIGEPNHANNQGGSSVWFKWQAPFSGTVIFNTASSGLDTLLAVYVAADTNNPTVGQLISVAANDDINFPADLTSQINFEVNAGTTYYIAVDGFGSAQGPYNLHWNPLGALSAGYFRFSGWSTSSGDFGSQRTYLGSPLYFMADTEYIGPEHPSMPASPGYVTVTRERGYSGRVRVFFTVTNDFFAASIDTNFYITNSFAGLLDANSNVVGFSNVFLTNMVTVGAGNNKSLSFSGQPVTCPSLLAIFGDSVQTGITNVNGLILSNSIADTNSSLPTPCRVPVITTATNMNGSVSNFVVTYCYTLTTNYMAPSATPLVDYLPYTNYLDFSDYEFSKQIVITNYPRFTGGFEAPINPLLLVKIDNVTLDPLETTNITPPTWNSSPFGSDGRAYVQVYNTYSIFGDPCVVTNFEVNIEKMHFQVPESIGNARIGVIRVVPGDPMQSGDVDYVIDYLFPTQSPNAYHSFDTDPASDYATPTNSTPASSQPADYIPVSGQLHWGANDFNTKFIVIPIVDDNISEFNEDMIIQIFHPTPGTPPQIGQVDRAILTINDNDAPAGSFDRGYNQSDSLSTDPPNNHLPGANGPVYSIAIQPDNKSIVGGDFSAVNTKPRGHIARMNSNGQVDTTFADVPNSGANGVITAVALAGDGNIYIAGSFSSYNGTNRGSIARLLPDGNLDLTFNPGSGVNGAVWSLFLQPDGKVVMAGNFSFVNGTNRNNLARLNTDGSVDPTFSPGIGPNGRVNTVAVQDDGRIMIGGQFSTVGNIARKSIARLMPNGDLDPSFDPGAGADDTVYSISLQADGRIIVAGAFKTYNLIPQSRLLRLNSTGNADLTFDIGSGPNDTIYTTYIQPDGRILIGGLFTSYNSTRRLALARVLPDGLLDTSFMDSTYNQLAGLGNRYADPIVEPKNYIYTMAVQADANVMIGGGFVRGGVAPPRSGISPRANIARVIGGDTPGPGNVGLSALSYNADENGGTRFVTLQRVNGNLGPASVTFGPSTIASGPGAAVFKTDYDFNAAAYGNPLWDTTHNFNAARPWMLSDGISGPNNADVDALGGGVNLGSDDVYVSILDNNIIDGTRTMNLLVSNPKNEDAFYLPTRNGVNIALGVALGRTHATLDIIDNESAHGTVGFATPEYTVNENETNAIITVLRTQGANGTVTVDYNTVNGTAIAGSTNDYAATSGQIQFLNGETNHTFTIPIVNNSMVQSNRTVLLRLTHFTGGSSPGLSNAVLTIIDDDFASGHVSFLATNFGTHELSGTVTITATRTGGNTGTVKVNYATSSDGTVAGGTAQAGVNYNDASGVLTWNSGDTAPKTFTVPVLHDDNVTTNKTVLLKLFNPLVNNTNNSTVLGLGAITNAFLTITNDDALGNPTLSTTYYTVNENSGFATITVNRIGGSSQTITVDYATSDGTALSNPPFPASPDYGPAGGTLTFGPGEFSKSFQIPIFNNEQSDSGNRFLVVTLSNPTPNGAQLGAITTATVQIIDDESFNEPPGGVDTTFNAAAAFNDTVYSLVLQADGKIVAGGDFTEANGFVRNRIARLNADGTLDIKFSSSALGADGTVRSIAVQSDKRIILGGSFLTVAGVNQHFISRLNLDGSRDITFNPGGGADNPVYSVAETFIGTGTNAVRKILTAGAFTTMGGATRHNIARLNDDGGVDTTFAPAGANGTIYAMAVYNQNDVNYGKILIGGDFTFVNGVPRNHVARLNPDGSLDLSFDPAQGPDDSVRAVAIQLDGKVLLGGLFASVQGASLNHLARLNGDGSIDSSFNVGLGANDFVDALYVQEDLKVLVGGNFTSASGVTRNRLTRLNPDGTVDPTINFGTGANDFVAAIAVQPDARIVIGGGFITFDDISKPHIARIYGRTITGSGVLEFTKAQYVVDENGTNAVISVRRRGGTGDYNLGDSYVEAFTTDDSAIGGIDYIPVDVQLVFPVGETFQTFNVPIIDNILVEPDKMLNLNLANFANSGVGNQPTATLKIINDDSAVSFSSATYRVAKNTSQGAAQITINRTGSTIGMASVEFVTTTNGTAITNLDYIPVTNTVVFAAGQSLQQVVIPVINNGLLEGDRTVTMALLNASNTIPVAPDEAILTIVDNNTAPGNFLFASQTGFVVFENSVTNGTTNATITVSRTNGVVGQISVAYSVGGGTAIAGVDYIATNNVLTFADGQTNASFNIRILHSANVLGDKTLNITLSNPSVGSTIVGQTVVPLTILDQDVGLSFSQAGYFVDETGGSVIVAVQRVGATNVPVSVRYATTNGTAKAGINYVGVSNLLTFTIGQTLKTFNIPVIHNPAVEGNLAFFVGLSNPTSPGLLGTPNVATITVIDDDSGLSFSTNSVVVNEAGTNALINVIRTGSAVGQVSVKFGTSNITAQAGIRYGATNGTLVFLDSEASHIFTVPIINDNEVDGDQTVLLSLSNPTGGASLIAPSNSVLTIIDDDAGFSFSSPAYSISEGGVGALITVVRSGVTTNSVSVNYATSDGTAHSGTKYVSVSGTLLFTNGVTTRSFTVPVVDNSTIEGDQTVLLTLSNPSQSSALVTPSAAALTIVDNDGSLIEPAGAALVAEGPGTVNGYIDANETVTLLFALRNTIGERTTNLVATLLATNGITVPSGPKSYGTLVPGGPSSSQPFTFTAVGTNGATITAILQLNDGAKSLGTVSFNFMIGRLTNNFANGAQIIINDASKATPYPSTLAVNGLNGVIGNITCTVSNLGHAYMSDVNILLVSPTGQKQLLMTHAGGGNTVTNLTLTYDDAAPNFLSFTAPTNGRYKPTQFSTTVPFPSPAPVQPFGTTMSGFNGFNPNGNWSLFVYDDKGLDSGAITKGWSMSFITINPIPSATDLSVGMVVNNATTVVSSNLIYSVSVTNFGPSAATGVLLTNIVPAGAAFVSAVPAPQSVTTNGGTVLVLLNLGSLGTNATTNATITLVPTALGSLTNIVRIMGDQADPNSGNNIASVGTTVVAASADLAVGLSASANPIVLGSAITYSISVSNLGPATATGVTVTNTLPPGARYNSSSPAGFTNIPGIIYWDLGSMGSGSTAALSVNVTILTGGTVNDDVSVSSNITDPLKGNNQASVKTTVDQLQLTITRSGNNLTFAWPVNNQGYVLESTTSLASPAVWTVVSDPAPQNVGGQMRVTVPISSGQRFFRLRAPLQ